MEARIAEQEVLIEQQAGELDKLRAENAALLQRFDESESRLVAAQREVAVWQALAEERRRGAVMEEAQ